MAVLYEVVEKGNFSLKSKSKGILPRYKGLSILVGLTFYSTLSPYYQPLSVSKAQM